MFPANTKILVVDDMKTMRLIMKKTLKDLGFASIEDADDGTTAWAMIEQAASSGTPYQLILSDWNMPKLPGIELLKKVRGHDSVKETPFLLVTAESEKEQVMEAIKMGVNQYITKPFTPNTVKEKLEVVYQKING